LHSSITKHFVSRGFSSRNSENCSIGFHLFHMFLCHEPLCPGKWNTKLDARSNQKKVYYKKTLGKHVFKGGYSDSKTALKVCI
jgi:hypothetical protein